MLEVLLLSAWLLNWLPRPPFDCGPKLPMPSVPPRPPVRVAKNWLTSLASEPTKLPD